MTFGAPARCGLDLSDAQIRLQVAVIADGHFPGNTHRCVVRLKRPRKVQRMHALLAQADVPYQHREQNTATAKGYTVFTFRAPTRDKVFTAHWWAATAAQLRAVAEEVLHWDGSVSDSKPTRRFSTTAKESADFVQYAFAATGCTARIMAAERRRGVEYNVQVRSSGKPLQLASFTSAGEKRPVMEWARSPDGYKYCFVVPSTYLLFRRNGCIFASGNTGKTLAALWAFDYLRSVGVLHKALVVSPLSTLDAVWGTEVLLNFPHLKFAVLHGDKARRQKLLAQDADVYIINHDGIKTLHADLLKRTDLDLLLLDELATYRTAGTDRYKAIAKLCAPPARWVWGMTGTPTPNEPTDAWAQCRLITPHTVPEFGKRFKDMTMRQLTMYKWIPKPDATATVQRAMQPAIRFTREECLDLPPTTWAYRDVEMSDEQRKAYTEMSANLRFQFQSGQAKAVNAADAAMKLVQIACGAVYNHADGTPIVLPNSARVRQVEEIIEQAAGKVLVFVPFTAALRNLRDALAKTWATEMVDGSVPLSKRTEVFNAFQHGTELRVIVANAETMSHGLTLTAADTVVWFAPTTSHETFDQANHRIIRQSQRKHTQIVMLQGSAVERKLYKRLQDRHDMQASLLDAVAGDRE